MRRRSSGTFPMLPMLDAKTASLLLRRCSGALLRDGHHLCDTAGLLELGLGGRREGVRANRQLLGDVTLGEDLHQRRGARHHAGVLHRLDVDLAVEALAEVAEVHREGLATKRVLEAALGQAALHRHLPAFETDAGAVVAGTGLLALHALAGGLAMARAHAAADALPLPVRAGVVLEIAERRSHLFTLLARRGPCARPRGSCRESPAYRSRAPSCGAG